MDSDSLIKLTKIGAKEIVAKNIETYIPPKVKEETIAEAKKEGYSDAFRIEENLNRKLLREINPKKNPSIENIIGHFNLIGGEADVLLTFKTHAIDAVSSDDGKFLSILEELEVPYLTPSAVIVNLHHRGLVGRRDAKRYVEKLKPMISDEEYYLAMQAIRGR